MPAFQLIYLWDNLMMNNKMIIKGQNNNACVMLINSIANSINIGHSQLGNLPDETRLDIRIEKSIPPFQLRPIFGKSKILRVYFLED